MQPSGSSNQRPSGSRLFKVRACPVAQIHHDLSRANSADCRARPQPARLTLPRPCALLRSRSSDFVTALHAHSKISSPSSFSSRHLPPHRHAANARTTVCRRSSRGRWARLLAARARQLGEYRPCPRLPAQPQLASLPLHPIVCLGSRTQASTAPFAACCPAPKVSSQRAHVDPLVLAAGKPSAQGLA